MKQKILAGCGFTYANELGNTTSPYSQSFLSTLLHGHFVVQGGGYWSQHIDIEGLIGDTFTVSRHNDSKGLFGLGYFVAGPHFGRVQLSYGMNAFYLPRTIVTAYAVQEDLFINLYYGYHIQMLNNLHTDSTCTNSVACSVRV